MQITYEIPPPINRSKKKKFVTPEQKEKKRKKLMNQTRGRYDYTTTLDAAQRNGYRHVGN